MTTSVYDEGYAAPPDADIAPDLTLVRPPERVSVDGKYLSLDGRPFHVRGVTYGSFAPRADGELFPERARVRSDFRAMSDAGLNTVRTYSVPPADVLDAAEEDGLRVIVGLHYDDWRVEPRPGRRATSRVRSAGLRAVDAAVERCAGLDNVLAIAVGNEVPGDLVRLHGAQISRAHAFALSAGRCAPAGCSRRTSTIRRPSTCSSRSQDLACFNVFLEEPRAFERYLRHLQIVAGTAAVLVTELGLASEVHGELEQARSLAWQLRAVEEAGCAGATVFAWTDEWAVAGKPVDGWGFGLTDVERRPKRALEVVRAWTDSSMRDVRDDVADASPWSCARGTRSR